MNTTFLLYSPVLWLLTGNKMTEQKSNPAAYCAVKNDLLFTHTKHKYIIYSRADPFSGSVYQPVRWASPNFSTSPCGGQALNFKSFRRISPIWDPCSGSDSPTLSAGETYLRFTRVYMCGFLYLTETSLQPVSLDRSTESHRRGPLIEHWPRPEFFTLLGFHLYLERAVDRLQCRLPTASGISVDLCLESQQNSCYFLSGSKDQKLCQRIVSSKQRKTQLKHVYTWVISVETHTETSVLSLFIPCSFLKYVRSAPLVCKTTPYKVITMKHI